MGLPYESLVETLDPEISDGMGFMGGKTKSVSKVYMQVINTAEVDVGFYDKEDAEFKWTLIKFPQAELWGDAPPLVSGYIDEIVPSGWRTEASIAFRQTYPLPMNVLSVTSEITVGAK